MDLDLRADQKGNIRPPAWLVACIVALLVNLPSLRVGWVGDDYIHRQFLVHHLRSNGPASSVGAWDMFNSHTPVEQRIAEGSLPWWTSPDLQVSLFRPLAVLSHYLDYYLWPESPAWMHAHNIALYLITVLLASALYTRLLPPRIAWIATLLYAADDANTLGVAWIAGRNTLLTTLFALLTLLTFVRYRTEDRRADAIIAGVALLLAHASSEGALGTWAYLVAYALLLDRGALRSRVLALVPLACVSALWVILTAARGFGVHGSGAYIDPRTQPLLFLEALTTRFPRLLLMQLGITPELSGSLPAPLAAALPWLAVLTFAGLVALLWYRRSDHYLLFMALGCVGSLLPICAVGAVGRLLFISGLGAHALIGALAATLWDRGANHWPKVLSWRVRAMAVALLMIPQLTIDGIGSVQAAAWWQRVHQSFYSAAESLPRAENNPGSLIMVVNARDFLTTPFVQLYHAAFFTPTPPLIHVLGVSTAAVSVDRLDHFSLAIQPEGGYLADATSILVRPRDLPFHAGQVIYLYGAQIHIDQITHDGRPARIRIVTFGLDDPRLLWVAWSDAKRRYERFVLPDIGHSITLPPMPANAAILP